VSGNIKTPTRTTVHNLAERGLAAVSGIWADAGPGSEKIAQYGQDLVSKEALCGVITLLRCKVMKESMLLLLLCLSSLGAEIIVVSPTGPIRTLAAARDIARTQRHGDTSGTITIQIRDGVYFLKETLVLTPKDSNAIWEAAPGAKPAISGGQVLSGWKKTSGPVWTADAGDNYFHQLFVSGRRAQRARTPNYGFYRIDGASPTDNPIRIHYRGNDIAPQWAGIGAEVIGLLA
jgi:hypothetical protein